MRPFAAIQRNSNNATEGFTISARVSACNK